MATIAIDPIDVREREGAPVKPARSRKVLAVVGCVSLGVAAVGGAAAALLSSVTFPNSLSGLAFLPKPDAPRRSEIRMGRLPDMPEIRNGVPEIVGTRPVRVIESSSTGSTSFGPKSVAATAVQAASFSTAALPSAFSAVAATPRIAQEEAFAPIRTVSARSEPVPSAPSATAFVASPAASARPPAPAVVQPAAAVEASVAPKVQPSPAAEPASTASVPDVIARVVPLPPPAPVRSAAAARSPDIRPDKPARATQVASRQAPPGAASGPVAVPPAPADDRFEVLGVKLPNGRDVRDAMSSIGDALNLPKVF